MTLNCYLNTKPSEDCPIGIIHTLNRSGGASCEIPPNQRHANLRLFVITVPKCRSFAGYSYANLSFPYLSSILADFPFKALRITHFLKYCKYEASSLRPKINNPFPGLGFPWCLFACFPVFYKFLGLIKQLTKSTRTQFYRIVTTVAYILWNVLKKRKKKKSIIRRKKSPSN